MTIKHCSIHTIERNKPGGEVKIQLRPNEHANEGPIVSLFEQLKLTIQRSTQRQYGLFDPNQTDNPLPALLNKLQNKELGFSSLTHQMMEQLKIQMNRTSEPFSSHILFVQETLLEQDFFYIFWIHHVEGQFFDKDLDIGTLHYVNPSKTPYALKLDMEQWKVDGWDQYLSVVISRGNKELSDGFNHFCGFISSVDVKAQTETFLSTVDDYVDQQPSEMSQQLKSKIVEYCIDQDVSGKPVDIRELSNHLNGQDPDNFASFISEKNPESKNEIYTDRASLKKYVRFFGRDKNLSISFSSEMFGDDIVFDEKSNSLIFKQIPKSLQAQLTRYLKRKHQTD